MGVGSSFYAGSVRKRGLIVLFGSLSAGLAWILWELLWPHEMVYRGKPVSVWVSIYCLEPSGKPRLEAVSNLIDLGTNGLPAILQIAATRDSPVKKLLLKIPVPASLLNYLKLKQKYDRWCSAANDNPPMAVRAFILMGRHYDHRIAVPGLIHLLSTSPNPKSRLAALAMLGYIADAATNAVPAVTLSLQDKDTAVSALAPEVLAAINSGTSVDLWGSPGGSTAARGTSASYRPATPYTPATRAGSNTLRFITNSSQMNALRQQEIPGAGR
jgi:hypothetical protein